MKNIVSKLFSPFAKFFNPFWEIFSGKLEYDYKDDYPWGDEGVDDN